MPEHLALLPPQPEAPQCIVGQSGETLVEIMKKPWYSVRLAFCFGVDAFHHNAFYRGLQATHVFCRVSRLSAASCSTVTNTSDIIRF